MAVDDAENPLQLLARASYLQDSPDSRNGKSPLSMRAAASRDKRHEGDQSLYAFFAPARARLDIGDEVDPVALGLVSDEEASTLFSLYDETNAHSLCRE